MKNVDWNDVGVAVIGLIGLVLMCLVGKVMFAGLDALSGK